MSNVVEIATIAVKALLVGLGLYLANNFRRQLELKLVERRADAYARLWSLMQMAGPWRLESDRGLMTLRERQDLYTRVTSWYFSGDGMLALHRRCVYCRRSWEDGGAR